MSTIEENAGQKMVRTLDPNSGSTTSEAPRIETTSTTCRALIMDERSKSSPAKHEMWIKSPRVTMGIITPEELAEETKTLCLAFDEMCSTFQYDQPDHPRHAEFCDELSNQKNKYSKFYTMNERLPSEWKNDVDRELKMYTHEDALRLVASAKLWIKNGGPQTTIMKQSRFDPLTHTVTCQTGIRAYYRVINYDKRFYVLEACHINSQGDSDIGNDLQLVLVNGATIVKGVPHSIMCQLYPGDVVAVVSLEPLETNSKLASKAPPGCRFLVSAMSILKRELANPIHYVHAEIKRIVVSGHEGNFVSLLRDGKTDLNTVYRGAAFLPMKSDVIFAQSRFRDSWQVMMIASKIRQRQAFPSGYIFTRSLSQDLTDALNAKKVLSSDENYKRTLETLVEAMQLR